MNLYECSHNTNYFDEAPIYVVAESFSDAERIYKREYDDCAPLSIKRISGVLMEENNK